MDRTNLFIHAGLGVQTSATPARTERLQRTRGMERQQQGPTDRWPADPTCLTLLTIFEIDNGDAESREVLLEDLLCAAWPSPTAQGQ